MGLMGGPQQDQSTSKQATPTKRAKDSEREDGNQDAKAEVLRSLASSRSRNLSQDGTGLSAVVQPAPGGNTSPWPLVSTVSLGYGDAFSGRWVID